MGICEQIQMPPEKDGPLPDYCVSIDEMNFLLSTPIRRRITTEREDRLLTSLMTRSYFTLEDSVVVHAKQVDLQLVMKVSQLGNNHKPGGFLNS